MTIHVLLIIQALSGKIMGTVIDEATAKPIAYANVYLLNTEAGSATGDDGSFLIINVPIGTYTLEVSCLGYQTKRIEGITVKVNQTSRLHITLEATAIAMPPMTVTVMKPVVDRDWGGTTYIITHEELKALPIDFMEKIIMLQPSVANVDTALHVRGGRATEVDYMIDNVSIIDPQTGDLTINVSKDIVDEVLFMPGGFDVEYGGAMSGVVNLVTRQPGEKIQASVFGKTEEFMPWNYDFGYRNARMSFDLPLTKRLQGLFNFDLVHTDDWYPWLFKLPHKGRDDYSIYGKLYYSASQRLNVGLTTIQSRSQFDRYHNKFKFHFDHYRSDWRKSNLEILNVNYLPRSNMLLNGTLSSLYTRRIYGVREDLAYGPFDDYRFRDYNTLRRAQPGFMNPFGVYIRYFRVEGDYYEYRKKSSLVVNTKLNTQYQISKQHETRGGIDYSYLDLKSFSHQSGDLYNLIDDDYRYKPLELSGYVQHNYDNRSLGVKIGCRLDHYHNGIDSLPSITVISPRISLCFLITNDILFRTNYGRYVQPPFYEKYYDYYNVLPLPTWITVSKVGNPLLKPEKTQAYEVGFQGIIQKDLVCNVNAYFKDVSDLLGTRFVPALPKSYVTYLNVEYAQIKGVEFVFDLRKPFFNGKISYSLSWAKGTSSYAEEVYYRYYFENPDTTFIPPTQDYYLDFDQRHRILVQGEFVLPGKIKMFVLNFWGNGFPYTPPGEEGKPEVRNNLRFTAREQLDCVMSKEIKVGKAGIVLTAEILNLFDNRYQIQVHQPWISLSRLRHSDFNDYIDILNPYYHPASDLNHDGMMSPSEEFTCFRELLKETDEWASSYSSPRRVRVGLSVDIE